MDHKRIFKLIDKHTADALKINPNQPCSRCGHAYSAHGEGRPKARMGFLADGCPGGIGLFVAKCAAESPTLTYVKSSFEVTPVPAPTSTQVLDAKLTASILIADIEKAQAELETMRCHESEMRSILTMDLDTLIYNATRAKHRMETNEWRILADSMLKPHIDSTLEAIKIHASAVLEITGKVDHIADMQKDLDALKGVL